MSIFKVVVHKSYESETWSNTYAIATGDGNPATDPNFTEDDLDIILGTATSLTNTNTDPDAVGYVGDNSIIAAIVGFERLLHYSPVTMDSVYLSDGLRDTTEFAVLPLGFPAKRTFVDIEPEQIMPGNVALYVTRSPSGVNSRSGRLQYRLCLSDAEVTIQGTRLLGLSNPATTRIFVEGAAADSFLDAYYFTATPAQGSARLIIPKFSPYVPGPPASGNELNGFAPWVGLGRIYAADRQVQRGRKRPTT